jgi:hypothetical protein
MSLVNTLCWVQEAGQAVEAMEEDKK